MTTHMPQDWPQSWEVPEFREDVFAERYADYCLVIPVINEGERIRSQLRRIADLDTGLDVIIADGGSTDGSLEVDFMHETNVRARLTKIGPGRLSAQLRMAYGWAMQQGYNGVVTIDGNGKDAVEGISTIRDKLVEGFDYVQGSRYAPGGRAVNTPFSRWFAVRFIHAPVISLAARHWFSDTTNGFRGYSRTYLTDPRVQPFRAVFNDYNLLFYLSVRASQLGFRVTEVGVTRAYPASGKLPTKITGLGSKLRLMGELFGAAFGAYHP
ncbi:MAG: glycosyltransferase family 2 protein [Hyphomicrobiales bacterium]